MSKKLRSNLKSNQILLPEELPFEKGTSISQQDACSRLTFQLLVERLLPSEMIQEYRLDIDEEEELLEIE